MGDQKVSGSGVIGYSFSHGMSSPGRTISADSTCRHCHMQRDEHAEDYCLFDSTTFESMLTYVAPKQSRTSWAAWGIQRIKDYLK